MTAEVGVWIDADGVQTVLDIEWDASDRFMPPVVFEEDGIPQRAGMRLRDTRHDARNFSLALWITAANDVALRTAMRDLVVSMNPKRGPGRIRFTSPTGDQREIVCSYSAGLGLAEKLGDTSGLNMQRATVVFRAHDPYWSAVSDDSATYVTGTVPNFFPFFPLRLATSQVVVDTSINNVGDLEAWPIITIVGPGSVIKATNLTTGLYTNFPTLVLATGESIIIDTRPGEKTAVMQDNTNVFPYISATSALWPLVVGSNAIRIEMSGATAGVSKVTFAYRRRYLSV